MLVELFFLNEDSQSNIVNVLGYPRVIARIFQNEFGKNAFLIAKWFKEYKIYKKLGDDSNWFNLTFSIPGIGMGMFDHTIGKLVDMYNAFKDGPDEYYKFLFNNDFDVDKEQVELYYSNNEEYKQEENEILNIIQEKLFKEIFFRSTFLSDIISGDLKDLKPYKNLSFDDAIDKFRNSKIFNNKTVIKQYDNGYTWRDVGPKCELSALAMKNCGSVGAMSDDPDRTLLVLFDNNNKAHAMVTYSPNDKMISSEEGVGSSELKSDYHDYVLDLVDYLGVKFNPIRSKSKSLSLKYRLKDYISNVETLHKDTFSTFIKFNIKNESYITDSKFVISQDLWSETLNWIKNNQDSKKFEDMKDEEFALYQIFYDKSSSLPSEILSKRIPMLDFMKNIKEKELTEIKNIKIENFFINENENIQNCLSQDDDPDLFYHATPSKYLPYIMRDGLQLNCPSNWPEILGGWCSDRIFVSYGFKSALIWKSFLEGATDEDIAILSVHYSGLKNIRPDVEAHEDGDECAFYVEHPISPQYLNVVVHR